MTSRLLVQRYGHTDCERNGKGDSGSRNRGQMKCIRQNYIRFRERCNLFEDCSVFLLLIWGIFIFLHIRKQENF